MVIPHHTHFPNGDRKVNKNKKYKKYYGFMAEELNYICIFCIRK